MSRAKIFFTRTTGARRDPAYCAVLPIAALAVACCLGGCSRRSSPEATQTRASGADGEKPSATADDADAFTAAFVARARAQHPGSAVRAVGTLSVALGDASPLDLRNLFGECNGRAAGCEVAIERWVRVLFTPPTSAAADRPSVRAVIVPRQATLGAGIVSRPFAGDLVEAFVVDTSDAIKMMNESRRAELGLDSAALHLLALENMRGAFREASIFDASEVISPAAPGVRVFHPTDSYANARLLFTDRWTVVASRVHGVLLAAAPARDIVVFTGDGAPDDVRGLRYFAQEMFAHEPHPIAPVILRWTGSGWEVLDANTAPLTPSP